MNKDMEALMKMLEPMLKATQAKVEQGPGQGPGMVAIPGDKMDQFLGSLSDLEFSEAMAMICLGASLIYRDGLEENLTILEFCDTVVDHIKEFINNPPPQFKSPKLKKEERVQDRDNNCDCPACTLMRILQAKDAERQIKERFANVGSPNVEDAEKPSADHMIVDSKGNVFVASTEK